MKRPWVYMSSPSRSPLPPPSPPAPYRSSQSTRSECLSHASNLGWWSVSPLIVYMFRCCSLETSHPRLLPQSRFKNTDTTPILSQKYVLSHFSCIQLCDPMDSSLPGSSVHEILQPRIMEWVAMPSSRGSSWPKDRTSTSHVSFIGRRILYHWATRWALLRSI